MELSNKTGEKLAEEMGEKQCAVGKWYVNYFFSCFDFYSLAMLLNMD